MRTGLSVPAACLAALALPLAAVPASAETADPPPPDRIVIDVNTVNGSGCRAGTTAVAAASDNTAFTVTYSDYLAQAGGGSNPTEFRKNCQINLNVHVPQGFTYAIAGADYRGFAHLEDGASGMEKANYYHQGMAQTTPVSHTIRGGYSDNWQFSDRTDVSELVFKPCGEDRNFNINTELRVYKGTSDAAKTSFMAFDSTDGSVRTTYHFAWKKCLG
ncbi:DUF4360 domain-containing protein [Actinomadura citrea]|uniref:DUF4360 domain-containing protein n=1 Tax=Actinomadura citrea TaxID=46158 RepID=A0A7Y9GJV4_9ACTN|nr:DUF4360 domain-containing protein [Actinomadura citrea]NYE17744.1 hypothetical protein [Actinomadura citrea]GGT61286.1 hypothetical protein GCM10010177_17430 [Actinomadura citrea]